MAFYQFFTIPRDAASLRQRNAELEAENSRLQTLVIELQQQVGEAQVAQALFNFAKENPENRYLAASVIGRDPSPYLQYIILDKGSDNGLRHGMAVVNEKGLVGRIDAITPGASRVQMITDAGSAINVRLQTSQKDAVLIGSITGDLTMEMIPQDLQIPQGEMVLTSGLGGTYPPNLFVGQIASIRRNENDLFQSAIVQPVVDFSGLKAVLVIVNFKPVNITPLIPTPRP
jgi:rod shape-determining protein MreC